MEADADGIIALTTLPSTEKAAEIGRTLVEEGVVACATLVPGARSIYRWQGQLCDDAETLVILKTCPDRVKALEHRLAALHPYDVPELIVLPVTGGHEPYLRWLRTNTR